MVRLLLVFALSCGAGSAATADENESGTQEAQPPRRGLAVAVFAGGCFWCMEKPFEQLDGVGDAVSGYTGGSERAPTYRQVSSHGTGHVEAIRVIYDPERVTYGRLLEVFWHNIDPTQDDGQFCDRGNQYRSAIFVANAEERRAAERSKREAQGQLGRRVVTEIRDAAPFWIAEDYHQNFYRTNPAHYQRYRTGCGRDDRLRALWGEHAGH